MALALVPDFEKRTGHKVTIDNDTASALALRIEGGESFDVVVATPVAIERMFRAGKIAPATATNLARVGIGVAIRDGAAAPDISTLDAFKRAMLAARAIAYTDPASGGTAGAYLALQFEQLGIAAELRPKSVLVKGGLSAERLLTGEADIALQPVSELLMVKGARVIGPLPAAIQTFIVYTGGVGAMSREVAAAEALLAAFSGPDALAVLKAKGMEPAVRD